jgi:hypothetical protein
VVSEETRKTLSGLRGSIETLQEKHTRAVQLNMANPPAEVAEDINALGNEIYVVETQVRLFTE